MITFQQARNLNPGDILVTDNGARWKVNGKVRLWRDPGRIYVPLKHGLYNYDKITEADFDNKGHCHLDLTLESESDVRTT